jgi:hypothetical protein
MFRVLRCGGDGEMQGRDPYVNNPFPARCRNQPDLADFKGTRKQT